MYCYALPSARTKSTVLHSKLSTGLNEVRNRANLVDLKLEDFNSADKLFEQIANVERPKEFGCEFGRGFDLIRWGILL